MAAAPPRMPPAFVFPATRPQDVKGGFDYGRWYLSPIGSMPFGTPALANTDVFPPMTIAGVTYPGLIIPETGMLRVLVSENTGVAFNLRLTRGVPPVTVTIGYNGGAALTLDAIYVEDVPVQAGDVVNFQFGAGTTIRVLDAYMILMMGP